MMIKLFLVMLPIAAYASDNVGYDWKCNLYCYQGGECRHGKSKFGSYAGVEETAELPWNSEVNTGAGMYCACPVGYTGLQCEITMKVCGDDAYTCFNGAACAKESDMDGKLWWRCECDLANSVIAEGQGQYAGKYCEHIATTFCNKKANEIDPGQSYCTNGGRCKEKDHEGQKHVGCICEPGFEGEHCEISTIKREKSWGEIASEATNSSMIGLVVGLVIAVIFLATFYLYFRDKKKQRRERRKRRLRNAGIETPGSFVGRSDGEMA